MSFYQLNPIIPLQTEKGDGEAIACIDYSSEHDLMWVVILDKDGSIWTVPNAKVRGFRNYSVGRNMDGEASPMEMLGALIQAHSTQPDETERQLRACLGPEDYRTLFRNLTQSAGYRAFMPKGD